MGTEVQVLLPVGRGDAITPVRELFASWEAKLSRFLPESELSRLNAHAGEPVVVGGIVFDVVSASVEAARATQGVFDPTLLSQVLRIGYAEPYERMPPVLRPVVGTSAQGGDWRRIRLDPSSRNVTLPAGSGIDLGGIAKGMAVDAALQLLRRRKVDAALVSAGGDLSILGLPPQSRAWAVLVGDDLDGEVVPLRRGALATSGVARRTWRQGGIRRHHLLDPRTGEPAESDVHEVTVAAATCKVAEVAATVCFVLGSKRGAEFLSSRRLAGLFTCKDGRRLTVGRWPTRVPDAA